MDDIWIISWFNHTAFDANPFGNLLILHSFSELHQPTLNILAFEDSLHKPQIEQSLTNLSRLGITNFDGSGKLQIVIKSISDFLQERILAHKNHTDQTVA